MLFLRPGKDEQVGVEASEKLNPLLQNILALKELKNAFTGIPSADYRAWQKTEDFKKLEKEIESPLIQERNHLIAEMIGAMDRFLEKLEKKRSKQLTNG